MTEANEDNWQNAPDPKDPLLDTKQKGDATEEEPSVGSQFSGFFLTLILAAILLEGVCFPEDGHKGATLTFFAYKVAVFIGMIKWLTTTNNPGTKAGLFLILFFLGINLLSFFM